MPNFKSISFKMAVLQAGRICPPHVCVIQKTPCGIGLKESGGFELRMMTSSQHFIWRQNFVPVRSASCNHVFDYCDWPRLDLKTMRKTNNQSYYIIQLKMKVLRSLIILHI